MAEIQKLFFLPEAHTDFIFSIIGARADLADPAPGANRTIDLEIARTFVAVCEEKSFRKAADRVNRSPSAVSLQIGKLEELLGCTLFDRNARRVILTEQGEVMLTYARRLLRLSDETLSRFRGSALSGTLRFAAPHDLGFSLVPDLLRHFAAGYPDIRVDVRLGSSRTTQQTFADGHVNDGAGPFDGVAFLNVPVVAENNDTDVVGFQVERHALDAAREFDHFAGLDLIEAVDASDTVTNGQHLTDFRDFGFGAKVGDLFLENGGDFRGADFHGRIPFIACLSEVAEVWF